MTRGGDGEMTLGQMQTQGEMTRGHGSTKGEITLGPSLVQTLFAAGVPMEDLVKLPKAELVPAPGELHTTSCSPSPTSPTRTAWPGRHNRRSRNGCRPMCAGSGG
jgi:hypothetical protein